MTEVPFYAEDVIKLEQESANLLYSMVAGALQTAALPPPPILNWFCKYTVYAMIMTESQVILEEGDLAGDEELTNAVKQVAVVLQMTEKQKMLGMNNELVNALKTRKLRYPTHMDLTYGGLLP